MFTNFRLIPCMVGDTLSRSVAVAHGAAGSSTSGSSPTRSRVARAVKGAPSAVGDTVEDIGQTIRDGFLRGAGRISDDVSDAGQDARLLRQLGMALGVVYAGFLLLWFWATRIRWQVRD